MNTTASSGTPFLTAPWFRLGVIGILVWLLSGCATVPPSRIEDACVIFQEKSDWYDYAKKSQDKWGVPVSLQLAIIHQESHFKYDAKPPRDKLFWFIPWTRASSAFGYAQVKDETWEWYLQKTGRKNADRDDFEDVVDFIGWYGQTSQQLLGIRKDDAYSQYLAYHEGHNGFREGNHLKKRWLIKVAEKVNQMAVQYQEQLVRCRDKLERRWRFWPFW
ncbi:MAG: transglycosylase SLT domain-containing protein [Magnetococcales bacterium]|nr:transglycosylase SLT domain-containing protein [Magnetococcales bacterium]NGZ27708.1 transglycosylase SLT domain-containing protein [Magnetococcales bacterium]